MTEAEWLACTDPHKMRATLRGKASDRKLRLFACACCRQRFDRLAGRAELQGVVRAAEQWVDGAITPARVGQVRSPLGRYYRHLFDPATAGDLTLAVHRVAARVLAVNPWDAPAEVAANAAWDADRPAQADLLRCLFGRPPFRPAPIDPAWLTWQRDTVGRLAQAAYEHRHLPAGTLDNGRLAVLADALEDAGCADADLVGHLRGPADHVRGCWGVDLLLRRE
jgi:hypothetical protein